VFYTFGEMFDVILAGSCAPRR